MSGKSSQGHTAPINYHRREHPGRQAGKVAVLGLPRLLCSRMGDGHARPCMGPETPPFPFPRGSQPGRGTPFSASLCSSVPVGQTVVPGEPAWLEWLMVSARVT